MPPGCGGSKDAVVEAQPLHLAQQSLLVQKDQIETGQILKAEETETSIKMACAQERVVVYLGASAPVHATHTRMIRALLDEGFHRVFVYILAWNPDRAGAPPPTPSQRALLWLSISGTACKAGLRPCHHATPLNNPAHSTNAKLLVPLVPLVPLLPLLPLLHTGTAILIPTFYPPTHLYRCVPGRCDGPVWCDAAGQMASRVSDCGPGEGAHRLCYARRRGRRQDARDAWPGCSS